MKEILGGSFRHHRVGTLQGHGFAGKMRENLKTTIKVEGLAGLVLVTDFFQDIAFVGGRHSLDGSIEVN